MLDFKAAPFIEAITALARAKLGCSNAKKNDQRETANGGVEIYQIDPVFRRVWSDDLEKVVRAASDLEISSTRKAARRLLSSLLDKDAIVVYADVERGLEEIESRLIDDLGGVLLLRVEARHKDSYRNPQPFGSAVNDAFPSAYDDISEAMTCHALERSTAAVMHAMRALEAPMGALAKVFGVPTDKGNWQNWIDQIEAAIRKISASTHGAAWKDEEKFYSEAARHFFYLKNAWRNHAMHAKDKYTEAQADEILGHVASFLKHLATRLKE